MDISVIKQQKSVGDSYKLVNNFINDVLRTNEMSVILVKDFLKSLDETNMFDMSVKLCVIDKLHLKEELLSCLLSQDVHQIKRAVKCSWFFNDCYSFDNYTKKIFPIVSVSTRYKTAGALSKYLTNEDEAEQYYEYFYQTYNHKLAEIFLPKCKKEFIVEKLKTHPFHLSDNKKIRIFKKIYHRFPDVVVQTIEEQLSNISHLDGFHSNTLYIKTILSALLNVIGDSDLKQYYILYNKYIKFLDNDFKIGKHRTKIILSSFKSDVLKQAEIHLKILNSKSFMTSLNDEEKIILFTNMIENLPRDENTHLINWRDVEVMLKKYLSTVQPAFRLNFYQQMYFTSFKQDIMKHPKAWSNDFLLLLPVDVREKCIESLFSEKIIDENLRETYFHMYNTCEVLDTMKNKLKKEPDCGKREMYILTMVESCAVNNDLKSLEHVCNYYYERHRNESEVILVKVLNLIKSRFKLQQFHYDLWISAMNLIKLKCLKETVHSRCYNETIEFFSFFLRFSIVNNIHYDDILLEIVKYHLSNSFYGTPAFLPGLPKGYLFQNKILFKKFIDMARENYVKLKVDDQNPKVFLYTFEYWNRFNKLDKINVKELEWLNKLIDDFINSNEYAISSLLHYDPLDFYKKIDLQKQSIEKGVFEIETLFILLKKDLKFFEVNLYKILTSKLSDYQNPKHFFLSMRKYFYFNNLNIKLCEIIKNELNLIDETDTNRIVNYLRIFSYFSKPLEFKLLAEKFLGEKSISYQISKMIKFLKPIDDVSVELLEKFLINDHLPYVHNSLCYISHHSHVEFIKKFLFSKIDQPVSIKKRILKMLSDVLTYEENFDLFYTLWTNEKHYSIQGEIFKVFKYYFRIKTDEKIWAVIKKCIVEIDDVNLYLLPKLHEIHDCFVKEYIDVVWFKLNNSTDLKLKENFLLSMNSKTFSVIDQQFPETIISNNLFLQPMKSYINFFTISYIQYLAQINKLDLLFLNKILTERNGDKETILGFFNNFFNHVQKNKFINDVRVVESMLNLWTKHFSYMDYMREFININLITEYVLIRSLQIDKNVMSYEFGNSVKNFYKNTQFSLELLPLFLDCFGAVFGWRGHGNKPVVNSLQFVLGILSDNPTRSEYILCVNLVKYLTLNPDQECYRVLYEKFKQFQDPVINIYIKEYFKKFD